MGRDDKASPAAPNDLSRRSWLLPVGIIGLKARRLMHYLGDIFGILSLTLYQTRNLADPARRAVFWKLFKRQFYNVGYKAIHVNCIIAALLGIGLADRGSIYIQKLENFADVFVVVVVREMAPLISGIILIARSATSVTAEIGHLQLNQEFDLLRDQGISPIFIFILPVLIAFPLSLLLMLVYFNGMALLASWFYIKFLTLQDWPLTSLLVSISERLSLGEILITATKAFVGGAIIGMVSLYSGYQVGDKFTDISRMISNCTTTLILVFFALNIGLSILAY